MKFSFLKLVPLAVLLAVGVFALQPAAGTPPSPAFANHNEEITIFVVTTPTTNDVTFQFVISGGCSASFSLKHNQSESRLCPVADGGVGIASMDVVPETSWLTQSINCNVVSNQQGSTAGAQTTFTDTSSADNDIVALITDNEHVTCTFTFAQSGTPVATATATGTVVPGGVTASAAPTTVGCNGSSFVTILVKTAAGANVPDGTPVTITTNLGTVNPTAATTSGGGTLTIFTAPTTQGGTATITATAGGVSGSTTVTVNCAAATATTAPPPPLPTATAAPVAVISPPSTGDGGLDVGRTAWRAPVGLLVIVASLLGGVALVRRRA